MTRWLRQARVWMLRGPFRPWALLTPVLVLVLALPMLRPLVNPSKLSNEERLLLASAASVARGNSLALDSSFDGDPGTVDIAGRTLAARAPMFAVLLAGPVWILEHLGLDDSEHDPAVLYILTVLATTLPLAVGAGVSYRMARLFELARPVRALLAAGVALGSGWFAIGTSLNPHVPAAACQMILAMTLLYLGASNRPSRFVGLMLPVGLLSGFACAIDPWALLTLPLLPWCILGMALPPRQKVIALLLLVVGSLPALWMHSAWAVTTFGQFTPPPAVPDVPVNPFDAPSFIGQTVRSAAHAVGVHFGVHGWMLHFPLVVFGVLGAGFFLNRNWPAHAKLLAGGTLAGLIVLTIGLSIVRSNTTRPMVLVAPMLVFWVGTLVRTWQRTPAPTDAGHPRVWLQFTATVAAAVSLIVSVYLAWTGGWI